mgnify:CR=1 FL=1
MELTVSENRKVSPLHAVYAVPLSFLLGYHLVRSVISAYESQTQKESVKSFVFCKSWVLEMERNLWFCIGPAVYATISCSLYIVWGWGLLLFLALIGVYSVATVLFNFWLFSEV